MVHGIRIATTAEQVPCRETFLARVQGEVGLEVWERVRGDVFVCGALLYEGAYQVCLKEASARREAVFLVVE